MEALAFVVRGRPARDYEACVKALGSVYPAAFVEALAFVIQDSGAFVEALASVGSGAFVEALAFVMPGRPA